MPLRYRLKRSRGVITDLLVGNGEFALRLHVVLSEGLQFLDGLGLKHGREKFDVLLGVFVSGLLDVLALGNENRRGGAERQDIYIDFGVIG